MNTEYCVACGVELGTESGSWLCPRCRDAARAENYEKSIFGGLRKMRVVLDKGAIMPSRAHDLDAGYDIYAREDKTVPANGSACFDTGVHIEIPRGYVGFLKSKSGLNVKHGITSEGVIDAGYTGSIVVKLYNDSEENYAVSAGDKISQIVLLPIYTPGLELVETLEQTERGINGFGSSGK